MHLGSRQRRARGGRNCCAEKGGACRRFMGQQSFERSLDRGASRELQPLASQRQSKGSLESEWQRKRLSFER